jgi:ABC-2 type transport system ATP-binding protein
VNGAAGPAISVDHLTKAYGSRPVVDDVSFEVRAGETFALLGPNGAGKTTTVEILEGFRTADAGTARVFG